MKQFKSDWGKHTRQKAVLLQADHKGVLYSTYKK